MRKSLVIVLSLLVSGYAVSADTNPLDAAPAELKIEIHSPSTDLVTTTGEATVEVEGVASAIGGVKFIDMMLVMDTSMSLRDTDPDNYRASAAVGLIESLPPKSDMKIGVIGFSDRAELIQPLTTNRQEVVWALKSLKRAGGTNLADGILTALAELQHNSRPESSRVIMLFTDGMSNEDKAREAAKRAQAAGIAVQTMLLGENLKGGFLLEEIAGTTGGTFVWVLDPTKLPEAFLNLRTTGVDSVTLSVNGSSPQPAKLTAGTFTGTLPLEVGENRIVALATSLDGRTKESTVTVTVNDASCAALEVAALNEGQPAISLNERAVEILVDASRSMWGQIDGVSKMAIAKDILHDASARLPEDLNLALRAYGDSSDSKENNCADSSLLVPFGLSTRAPIHASINDLKPRGQTPIAFALRQAAGDFAHLQSERTLVLVTDGIESCGGDPVAAARDLRAQGITTHVIGFGMGSAADEDTWSLQAIASASGGHYFTANSADELRSALETTVSTPFRVLQNNDVVARGVLGSTVPMYLPTGDYRVELDSVPPHSVAVRLDPRDSLTLMLEKDAGIISHSEYRDTLQPTSCEDAIAATKRAQERAMPSLTSVERSDSAWQ